MAEKLCYNRGCGKNYNPRENTDDSCTYHPGAPYFHDAYKGWSCCQNKSTDFTTFLNTPGCTRGKHSNVKPVEPEKITGNLSKEEAASQEQVEVRAPIQESLPRPPLTTACVRLQPTVAPSLVEQVKSLATSHTNGVITDQQISIGEACKNSGCKNTYRGPEEEYSSCKHHPGIPVFHEGMKYWSCCERKTTEFQQFLDQEGCTIGTCLWKKEEPQGGAVTCRYDWHQTATHVTVAIYAKKYDPSVSFVELSPVRLRAHLFFPQEKGSFNLDLELRGIVDVEGCSCSMLGTKVEVKMKKAESGSWAKLDIPSTTAAAKPAAGDATAAAKAELESKVDAVDLEDIEFTSQRFQLSEEARTRKY